MLVWALLRRLVGGWFAGQNDSDHREGRGGFVPMVRVMMEVEEEREDRRIE